MQQRRVGLILELSEHRALLLVGVLKQLQRLVGMAGQYHVIEVRGVAGLVGDMDPPCDPAHGHRSALEIYPVAKGCHQPLDVAPGATAHGAPGVLGVQSEEAVVVEKAQQRHRRKLQHVLRRRGPDGAAHGQQVVVQEPLAVVARAHVVTQVPGLRLR